MGFGKKPIDIQRFHIPDLIHGFEIKVAHADLLAFKDERCPPKSQKKRGKQFCGFFRVLL